MNSENEKYNIQNKKYLDKFQENFDFCKIVEKLDETNKIRFENLIKIFKNQINNHKVFINDESKNDYIMYYKKYILHSILHTNMSDFQIIFSIFHKKTFKYISFISFSIYSCCRSSNNL